MRLEAWPSNHLTRVSPTALEFEAFRLTAHAEMLTPIDQPLDKLEDLKPDEM